jgi:hypothetical protein
MPHRSPEERLQLLEDIQEITQLKARYFEAANGGWPGKSSHDGIAVAALFAEDGTWETIGYPRAAGRAAIRTLFRSFRLNVPLALHMAVDPIIQVNGDTGVGEWYMMCLHSDREGSDSLTILKYHDEFVRTRRAWRFKSILGTPFMHGPYADGWTRLINNLKPTKVRRKTSRRHATP